MKPLHIALCAFVLSAISFSLGAQNLISNPSFEFTAQTMHYLQVNHHFYNPTFPTGWTTASDGSPDLFNNGSNNNTAACGSITDPQDNPGYPQGNQPYPYGCYPVACTSENPFGRQAPRAHGPNDIPSLYNDNYVGFSVRQLGNAFSAEYFQTTFAPLNAGACYELSFWVSRADLSDWAYRIQAVISTNDLYTSTTGVLTYPSDAIVLTSRNPIYDKKGWVQIVLPFRAKGGETHLTFGIFDVYGTPDPEHPDNPNLNIPIRVYSPGDPADCNSTNNPCFGGYPSCGQVYPSIDNGAYYYLDDVVLKPFIDDLADPITSFSNQTINGGTYSGNVLITGNINISGTVTFDAANVKCNGNTIITVPVGSSLRFVNNTNVTAGCNYMWHGIVVYGNVQVTNSSINDAVIALNMKTSSTWQIFHSNFTANADDIVFTNAGGSSYITGTTFDHTVPLQDPQYGTNGFGTTAITINPQSNSSTDVIGGNAFGDGCTFLGGVYGIKCSSHNLKVEQCSFDGVQQYAIYFQGNLPGAIRQLEVKSSHFTNNRFDISSYLNTNLIVTGSDFFNSWFAILWTNNSNCNLHVGSDWNPNDGNLFKSIRLSAIECWNNKCTSYQAPYYMPEATNIVIGYNNISAGRLVNCYKGIGINEFTLGSFVTYRKCDISNNTITDVQKGIEFYQARGWGGWNPNPPQPSAVVNNRIIVTTLFNAAAKGITMKNSPGFNIIANSIESNEPYTWQNTGIYLENSQYTKVEGNVLGSGTGIVYVLDEKGSVIQCNSFTGNSCGINMAYAALRAQDVPHGNEISPGNWEAYNNYYTGAITPWTIEIQNYYSNISFNRWVWDNTVLQTYPQVWDVGTGSFIPNLGTGSVLSPIIPSISSQPIIGFDDCPYGPVFGGNISNPDPVGVENPQRTIGDPVLQWIVDYDYQAVKNNGGPGNAGYASQNIKRILRIEDAITQENFSLASAQLNGLFPENLVEENYKQVLSIQLAMKINNREATQAEKDALILIANQNPRIGGPAVQMSRAYLFHSDFMIFEDEDLSGPKIFGTAFVNSPCCIAPASGTVLTFADQMGNELPIPGATVQPDGSFAFDPFQIRYYSSQNPNTTYRIKEKQPSKYTVLNKDFHTLQDWLGLSPVSVTLGGVVKIYDTIIPSPDTVIAALKVATDTYGNTIYIDSAASTNFVVKKMDTQGNVVWTQDFSGVMTSLDSATSLSIAQDNSIYVAGSKNNNGHSDFVIAKLDSTGFIEWHHIAADTTGGNSTPTAIGSCNSGQTICAIGLYSSANGTSCKKIKYTQCISSSNLRIQNQPNEESTPMANPISVYPNPTAGGLTVIVPSNQAAKMELISTTGQTVYAQNCEGASYIDLAANQVADGVYLIKFTLEDGSQYVDKLIVRRSE